MRFQRVRKKNDLFFSSENPINKSDHPDSWPLFILDDFTSLSLFLHFVV